MEERIRFCIIENGKAKEITFDRFQTLNIFKDSKEAKEIWNKFKDLVIKEPKEYFDTKYRIENIKGQLFIGGFNLSNDILAQEIINYEVFIGNNHFEWDEVKNKKGENKHGVRFEEAITSFQDELAVTLEDEKHSTQQEQRFILIGFSKKARLLVVSYCMRGNDNITRIITSFPADKKYKKVYNERNGFYE